MSKALNVIMLVILTFIAGMAVERNKVEIGNFLDTQYKTLFKVEKKCSCKDCKCSDGKAGPNCQPHCGCEFGVPCSCITKRPVRK